MEDIVKADVLTAVIDEWSTHPMRSGDKFMLVTVKGSVPEGHSGPYALFRPIEHWLVRERPALRLTLRISPGAKMAHRPRAEILRFEEVRAD